MPWSENNGALTHRTEKGMAVVHPNHNWVVYSKDESLPLIQGHAASEEDAKRESEKALDDLQVFTGEAARPGEHHANLPWTHKRIGKRD